MNRNALLPWLFLIPAITLAMPAMAGGAVSVEFISSFTYHRMYTTSEGISNDGATVGSYEPSSGNLGYLRSRGGSFSQTISFPGADRTYPASVNTSGVVCGTF